MNEEKITYGEIFRRIWMAYIERIMYVSIVENKIIKPREELIGLDDKYKIEDWITSYVLLKLPEISSDHLLKIFDDFDSIKTFDDLLIPLKSEIQHINLKDAIKEILTKFSEKDTDVEYRFYNTYWLKVAMSLLEFKYILDNHNALKIKYNVNFDNIVNKLNIIFKLCINDNILQKLFTFSDYSLTLNYLSKFDNFKDFYLFIEENIIKDPVTDPIKKVSPHYPVNIYKTWVLLEIFLMTRLKEIVNYLDKDSFYFWPFIMLLFIEHFNYVREVINDGIQTFSGRLKFNFYFY